MVHDFPCKPGRTHTSLFITDWLLDADMQRRATIGVKTIGLNKGEAHRALRTALRIGRQGDIRAPTAEGRQGPWPG